MHPYVAYIWYYITSFNQPSQATPLSPSVKELIDHTLVPLLEMYETEDNKLVTFIFFLFPDETKLSSLRTEWL